MSNIQRNGQKVNLLVTVTFLTYARLVCLHFAKENHHIIAYDMLRLLYYGILARKRSWRSSGMDTIDMSLIRISQPLASLLDKTMLPI